MPTLPFSCDRYYRLDKSHLITMSGKINSSDGDFQPTRTRDRVDLRCVDA